MHNKVIELLSARWLINIDTVFNYMPLFISYINGAKITENDFTSIKPYALSLNLVDRWDLDNGDIPQGSILVLPLDGPISSYRSKSLIDSLRKAEANPNIIAGILQVNSPGGMVHYTDIASDAIANSRIPFVSFVENMAASAAMWWISGTKRIFLSSPLDRVGSIGVMTSLLDFSKMLKEKFGIEMKDFYADKSTRKNEEIRAYLEKGDDSLIRAELNFANEIFHETIKKNLGIKDDSPVLTGALYHAKEAIELGLAHEIGDFNKAVEYAFKLGMKNAMTPYLNG